MGFRFLAAAGLAIGLTTALVPVVGQAQDAKALVDQRIKSMKTMGGHMGALSKVAKGEVAYSPEVVTHAEGVVAVARQIESLFPQGSVTPDSRAKPEIWTMWSQFQQSAGNLRTEAEKLAAVAKGNDVKALGTQLAAVGKTCGGCHDTFRKPQQQ